MKIIELLCYNKQSIGIRVIVDAFVSNFRDYYHIKVIHSMSEHKCGVAVIPYGPKETFDALRNKCIVPISLMVDYHTLSLQNRVKYLVKNGYLFNKDVLKSIILFFYYYIIEMYIYRRCMNFMFVSTHDINHIKRRYPNNNYYCVPNGVNIPETIYQKPVSNTITLGILSGWTAGTFIETRWFIERYWPDIISKVGNVELLICGKYATPEMVDYFNKQSNVKFIGEVENRATFFDQVDIYVATKPIGCGILNKVLDAMAYKKLVIGIKESFTGFSYMKDSYIVCNTIEDYVTTLNCYKNNPSSYNKYTENAFCNLLTYNNWEKNYEKFVEQLKHDNISQQCIALFH